jgi:LacI family transcriptional regulator
MRGRRRTTLADVAARAGVSVTSASYILNSRSEEMRISAETTERVRLAARELSYRPNRSARNLRSSSTATIGVISDHVASGSFASRMISGAATAARVAGHLLVVGETEGDRETEALLVEEMLDRQVEGIIYATLVASAVTVPAGLRGQNVVLLNCVDLDGQLPALMPDEYEGGRTAVSALFDAGHRGRVWAVGGETDLSALAGGLRMQGILARLQEVGGLLAGVLDCEWAVVPAYEAVRDLLSDQEPPESLICLNDRIAMGAYDALREHGLRVPEDVTVVSFDGSDLAGWLRPSLTSVRIPFAELGAAAVTTLLDGPPDRRLLPMPLLRGHSTASVAGRPPTGRRP